MDDPWFMGGAVIGWVQVYYFIYDYTIKGAIDEKKSFDFNGFYAYLN